MFKKVEPKPDFPKIEHKILDFWGKNKCFEKLQKKLKGKKNWSFIDGPITANNPMGVHHAWGRTYKDVFQRFKAMQGFDQRWQNGFDCQGLWVEVEEERDLDFNSKRDILDYGLDKFSRACRSRVNKYSKIITEQSKRLGQWMDWKNSYYTMSDTNIQYIWYFLKKCQEKGWLYKGNRVMPWCTRCGTSLSQHELADSYKEVVHDAVYLQLPIKNKRNEYLLVWTTTPWTLSSNTACAVHPDLTYVKIALAADTSSSSQTFPRSGDHSRSAIRHQTIPLKKQTDRYFILAKKRLGVLKDLNYKVVEEFKGRDLVDLEYFGPFDELEAQKGVIHKVIPWEEVGEEEGTGIVHIAPGCGEEDYELGKEFNLAVIAPLDEFGVFVEGFGNLTGKDVHQVKGLIFESLKKKGYFFKAEKYKHRYPFCWRCSQELVFRLVEEWFIKSDEIRIPMKKEAKKVKWIPEYIGKRMQDWLDNMGDWCISRKRFWGLPLPFYQCSCGHLEIVASKKELVQKAVKIGNLKVEDKNDEEKLKIFERFIPELHRPWIDELKIKCSKCGKEISRITEVGDCWLDAGIVPFSTLKYFEDKNYWKKWFPAKLVVEMREQVRLWFYSLLFMSVTLENKAPYETVFCYERVCDEKGRAMHRSLRNVIWFDEATEKMGADVMRWMYCSVNPAYDLRFGYKKAKEIRRKLILLWNVYLFFVNYAIIEGFQPLTINHQLSTNKLDKWILSLLNKLILEFTERLNNYDVAAAMRLSEKFLEDLSTWYVRRSRRRFWKAKNKKDKKEAYQTLYYVLTKYILLMAPILPFITEEIYQNLVSNHQSTKESIHLCDWPKANRKLIDENLNRKMQLVRDIAALGLAIRAENRIKVKQPLEKLEVKSKELETEEDRDLLGLVKDELNVKKVSLVKEIAKNLKVKKENNLEVGLDIKITPELEEEGIVRQLIRYIQEMRKEAKYKVDDKISIFYQTENKKMLEILSKFNDYIKKETLSLEIKKEKAKVDKEKKITIDEMEVWLGVKR